ncbi:MAG: response regulator [Mariprofundaceae bacterium]
MDRHTCFETGLHPSSDAMREELRVLVVEDDIAIARLIEIHLKAEGYFVACCHNGTEAMHQLQEQPWQLVILDRMLPGRSGMHILRWLRHSDPERYVPVLMVTALDQTSERVHGLKQGADDYLAKPFEPEELVARVEALLRRTTRMETKIKFKNIQLDPDIPELRIFGKCVDLRRLEFQLLHALMKREGKVCRREYLLNHVWGRDAFVEPRTVDVAVKRLRNSLAGHNFSDCIETVRGVGYRFVQPVPGQ